MLLDDLLYAYRMHKSIPFSIWFTHHHHQWTAFPQSELKSTEIETATMMLDLDEYDPLPTTTCTVPADAQSRPGFDTQNQN
jgi:hypothetical protein